MVKQNAKWLGLLGSMIVIAALALVPAVSAQSDSQAGPLNTITVHGEGQAFGSPDVAYVEVGVNITNSNVSEAFASANTTMDAIMAAMEGLGIDRKDMRTTGINLWTEERYGPEGPTGEIVYRVGNTLRITVRDVSISDQVLTAAVDSGANTIYNFNFGIADTDSLERDARVDAVADARARAEHLAEVMGVTLGKAVIINESYAAGGPVNAYEAAAYGLGGGGGGNVPVEQGQLSVNVQLLVTFEIVD